VTHAAAVQALNDTLAASLAATGPFTGSGAVSGIAAGASNAAGSLTVGLNTAAAGVYGGTATVGFASQNPDLADLGLGSQQVSLSAIVNNIAEALFVQLAGAGALAQADAAFVLDLGTLAVGDSFNSVLGLRNGASGPADDLYGSFAFASPVFSYLGWDPIAALAAGATQGGLQVSYTFDALGLFEDVVTLNWRSVNGVGPDLAFASTLRIRANVIDGGGSVPEPGTWALLVLALALLALVRRRPMH
jgi:hypothetical protein